MAQALDLQRGVMPGKRLRVTLTNGATAILCDYTEVSCGVVFCYNWHGETLTRTEVGSAPVKGVASVEEVALDKTCPKCGCEVLRTRAGFACPACDDIALDYIEESKPRTVTHNQRALMWLVGNAETCQYHVPLLRAMDVPNLFWWKDCGTKAKKSAVVASIDWDGVWARHSEWQRAVWRVLKLSFREDSRPPALSPADADDARQNQASEQARALVKASMPGKLKAQPAKPFPGTIREFVDLCYDEARTKPHSKFTVVIHVRELLTYFPAQDVVDFVNHLDSNGSGWNFSRPSWSQETDLAWVQDHLAGLISTPRASLVSYLYKR